MYFRLNPECYLIRGKKLGAIFDLIDHKIYALNELETEIVTSCEKNNSIQGERKFLNELKQLCLGNFYSNRSYIQKLRVGSPTIEKQSDPPELHRAFIEINNSCNRNCWFCGHNGIKRSLGCMGCNKWNENGRPLSIERWKEVIDELKDLNCMDIFITGGDLTLEWDRTIDILDYTNRKFTNIYITLHRQSLSIDKINELAGKANMIIKTEDYNDVQSLDTASLLVTRPENFENIEGIQGKNIMVDFIIERGNLLPKDLPITSKKKIQPGSMYQFFNNIEYHPCLGHTLAICFNGNVIPCPMMRGHSFGNVSNKELYAVLKSEWERIDNFWELNLDKIEKCCSCEFRYSCADCRSLEESLTGKLDGKMLCNYDPSEGKWS